MGGHRGFEYARSGNPTRAALEACVASLESARHGLAFASGLAAVATVLDLVGQGQKVVAPRHSYNGTIMQLADLESREVLLAKVAGGMQGVLQQAISLVAAPLSQAARVFAALEKAAEENPSLIAGAGAPVAEQTQEPTNDEIAAEANESAAPAAEPTPEAADAAADQ